MIAPAVNVVPAIARRMPPETRQRIARRLLEQCERAIPAMRTCDLNAGSVLKDFSRPLVDCIGSHGMLMRRANKYRRFIRRAHAAAFEMLTEVAL